MALIPVIPVLGLNTDQLTRKDDQLAYILRHAFNNPGWTSSQIEGSLVSMRRLLAKYEQNPGEFTAALRTQLETAIKHLYATYTVNVSYETLTPQTYKVIISIVDGNGQPVLSSDAIKVVDNRLVLSFDTER